MTFEVLVVLALTAVVGVLAWIGLRGGELRREAALRLVCPVSRQPVDCAIVQNVRTGQWTGVQACSAFPDGHLACAQDCARVMNLGFQLPTA